MLKEIIKNRYEAVLFFDVKNGNPNGDPSADNMPRLKTDNKGIVTDVCIKRKVRNYVMLSQESKLGYEIYIKENSVLSEHNQRAFDDLGIKYKKNANIEEVQKVLCKKYYDVRTFGAVMVGNINVGNLRGPIQITFSESIDEIEPELIQITRCAKTNTKEGEDNKTMGNKWIIPYAIYRAHIFINPGLAEMTGFTELDLELFWKALVNMFDLDRSAARGEMNTLGLKIFKHTNKWGVSPAQDQLNLVSNDMNVNTDKLRSDIEFIDYR